MRHGCYETPSPNLPQTVGGRSSRTSLPSARSPSLAAQPLTARSPPELPATASTPDEQRAKAAASFAAHPDPQRVKATVCALFRATAERESLVGSIVGEAEGEVDGGSRQQVRVSAHSDFIRLTRSTFTCTC